MEYFPFSLTTIEDIAASDTGPMLLLYPLTQAFSKHSCGHYDATKKARPPQPAFAKASLAGSLSWSDDFRWLPGPLPLACLVLPEGRSGGITPTGCCWLSLAR